MYNVENGIGKRSNNTNRFNMDVRTGRKWLITRLEELNNAKKYRMRRMEHLYEPAIPEPDKATAPTPVIPSENFAKSNVLWREYVSCTSSIENTSLWTKIKNALSNFLKKNLENDTPHHHLPLSILRISQKNKYTRKDVLE